MSFADKVVLITGAAGGIGSATVKLFAEKGAKVSLVDLRMGDLERTAKELNLQEGKYLLIPADVAKEEEVIKYVTKTKEHFGRIDVFYNNAGIEGAISDLANYPSDVFNKVVDINIRGAFFGLKYVLQVMLEQKSGSIINCSSIGGLKGMPGTSAYVASKFAIIGMTKTAAKEYATQGIRVNAICPAMINTRMMRSIEQGINPEDAVTAKSLFEKDIPMGRYGEPEEVARAVLFLASEEASFITGVALPVDGAFTA